MVRRLSLIFEAFIGLVKFLIFKKKRVKYFGHEFIHESIVGPALIYPYEISSYLLKQLPEGKLQNVLDIGGNLGQFSITLLNMAKVKRIDIIEPNPYVFSILQRNSSGYKPIRCYNVAIGQRGKHKFYYEENKSATGSFIKNNSFQDKNSLREITVEVTDKIHLVTGISHYDLIKVDVEGYEYQVIKNLKGVSTKYLFLEVSSDREKEYVTSELYKLLVEIFGSFEVLFQRQSGRNTKSFDILLKFGK